MIESSGPKFIEPKDIRSGEREKLIDNEVSSSFKVVCGQMRSNTKSTQDRVFKQVRTLLESSISVS